MLGQKNHDFPEGKTNEGTAQLSQTICKHVATDQGSSQMLEFSGDSQKQRGRREESKV
jgi:hypothetical protein